MPSAVSGQNNYYSRHHRRQSSMSQTSLPDQLKNNGPALYGSNRSAIFLPATTYGQQQEGTGTPPPPSNAVASEHNVPFPQFDGSGDTVSNSEDPDDFYRQYQNQHISSLGASLHQEALRTTDLEEPPYARGPRRPSFSSNVSSHESAPDRKQRRRQSSGAHDAASSQTSLSGPRSRKASVKNLVAQINASSTEDLPPLPVNPISRPGSRNVSPIIPSAASFEQHAATNNISSFGSKDRTVTNGLSRVYSRPSDSALTWDQSQEGESFQHSNPTSSAKQDRRPLFGEVLPNTSLAISPGFGIQANRPRTGSEGSPLESPNPIFMLDPNSAHDISSQSYFGNDSAAFTLSPDVYVGPQTTPRPSHRRANSDFHSSPVRTPLHTEGSVLRDQNVTPTGNRQRSNSRIPVTSNLRSNVSSSHQRLNDTLMQGQSSLEPDVERIPGKTGARERSSPRRRQRSPPQIKSPGSRVKVGKAAPGSKSPTLRANIIVPPPKISPPLRSSRPRLPVSSASTAASRARMAEKFNAMQKKNNEKKETSRRPARPPELTDIDLKARRLRITQALSRSLEGQDLKGGADVIKRRAFSSSRTASPAISLRSQGTDSSETRQDVPALVIDDIGPTGNEEYSTPTERTQQDERKLTQSALHAMQGALGSNDDDSPTLGHSDAKRESRPSPLKTDFLNTRQDDEPSSAITDATEFTNIDPDPSPDLSQPMTSNQSLLSHINHMRSSSPKSPNFTAFDDFSDNADEESVHIILRDTAYLDDDEAVRKGYRTAPAAHDPLPEIPQSYRPERDSWASSAGAFDGDDIQPANALQNREAWLRPSTGSTQGSNSNRSTMAGDAYTIVSFVLQQHSPSGIVDQQFVDEVYQQVLQTSPFDNEGGLDPDKIEQLCLREIQKREENWRNSIIIGRNPAHHGSNNLDREERPESMDTASDEEKVNDRPFSGKFLAVHPLPKPAYKNHRYKPSLDSAEDWADTSPSVGDWMRYAHDDDDETQKSRDTTAVLSGQSSSYNERSEQRESLEYLPTLTMPQGGVTKVTILRDNYQEGSELYAAASQQQAEYALPTVSAPSLLSTEATSDASTLFERPDIPRRVTSVSKLPHEPVLPVAPSPAKTSLDETVSPEQRRIKQRRHVMKELVDTEFTYERDMRVLCDIYKQTASAALTEDDIKTLFGNVEQIQEFSKTFLSALKSTVKPIYVMDRTDRRKDKGPETGFTHPNSSSSTLASTKNAEAEVLTPEKDRETRVGQAFESSLANMQMVYGDYIRNRHAANQRLEAIQKSTTVKEWLKECRDNSSDITNAWDLDSLLVKPVQRVTKYPLLLKELVDSTPKDHPDISYLQRALHEVIEINVRINNSKKHTELVDQVLSRKRKDSDVRLGLSKAFGRRTEKLKQHVGLTEMYEDNEYNEVKINYDNNIVQLMVVCNDCSQYGRAITKWVNRMIAIASAAESWVDVGHSNHQEAESRLRQFAMVVRGISTIALPEHLQQLATKVLHPMEQAAEAMNKFKIEPKGLLMKRDKRLIDYAQAKNKKEKGEKIDKKMTERMEQWEALNVEAKDRMKKLIRATAKLVQACQGSLIQMQMTWVKMVNQKLSTSMGISLERLEAEDIEKEWQIDFDHQLASALDLAVCNGSLLAEAVNMLSFQTPSSTLNGEDSPRQLSFSSATKRSISYTSDGPHVPVFETTPRTSGTFLHQQPNISTERVQSSGSSSDARARAVSTTSLPLSRMSEPSFSRNGPVPKFSSAAAGYGPTSYRDDVVPPRVSLDTPSPFIGSLQPELTRPPSSSTFFSAVASAPPPPRPHHQSSVSSVFSSAMPMPDSPVMERGSNRMEFMSSEEPQVMFTAASVYEFNIDRSRREAGFPYLTYVTGEIFDVIGERGELWLARNQDDHQGMLGWIWNKHFAKLAE